TAAPSNPVPPPRTAPLPPPSTVEHPTQSAPIDYHLDRRPPGRAPAAAPPARSSLGRRLLVGLGSAAGMTALALGYLFFQDARVSGHLHLSPTDFLYLATFFALPAGLGGAVAGTSRVRWAVILACGTAGLVSGVYRFCWWWLTAGIHFGGFLAEDGLDMAMRLSLLGIWLGFLGCSSAGCCGSPFTPCWPGEGDSDPRPRSGRQPENYRLSPPDGLGSWGGWWDCSSWGCSL